MSGEEERGVSIRRFKDASRNLRQRTHSPPRSIADSDTFDRRSGTVKVKGDRMDPTHLTQFSIVNCSRQRKDFFLIILY